MSIHRRLACKASNDISNAYMRAAKVESCTAALREFHDWFRDIEARLKTAIADSSLGTGYEEQLTRKVYRLLGLHPVVGESVLSRLINVSKRRVKAKQGFASFTRLGEQSKDTRPCT